MWRLVTAVPSFGQPLTACIVPSVCPHSRQAGEEAFFILNARACVYSVPVATLRALVTSLHVTLVDVRYAELTLSTAVFIAFLAAKYMLCTLEAPNAWEAWAMDFKDWRLGSGLGPMAQPWESLSAEGPRGDGC